MPNYCNFDAYLIGSKKDINKFHEVMEADYSYGLNKDFIKSLGIYKEDDWVFTNEGAFINKGAFISLEEVRRKVEGLKNNFIKNSFYSLYNKLLPLFNKNGVSKTIVDKKKVLNMLKDENLKREYFNYIPECGHFYRVFDYCPDENMEKIGEDTFISRTWGTCAWSLDSTIVDSEGTGYYEDALRNYPEHILTGTNLMEFSKKVPDLKIALISQEPGCEFSEFYTFVDGELIDADCETFREVCYESVKDAADDGIKITEDELGEFLYLEFPEWFDGDREEIYVKEDYVFEKLGLDY